MWICWIILLAFWLVVYYCKRRSTSLAAHNPSTAENDSFPVRNSPVLKTASKLAPKRRTADRESDAEERSSISSGVSDDDEASSDKSARNSADPVHQQEHETVRLGVGQLVIESDRYNLLIHRIAAGADARLDRWRKFFATGQLISVMLIIPCVFLLIFMLISMSQDVVTRITHRWSTSNGSDADVDIVGYYPSESYSNGLLQTSGAQTATASEINEEDKNYLSSATDAVTQRLLNNSKAFVKIRSLPTITSAKPARYTVAYDTNWIPHLKLLLPGLNIDTSHLLILLIAVLICTLIHESGHAIAAVVEGLRLESVGLAFVVCFPIAFVRVDIDGTSAAEPSTSEKNKAVSEVRRGSSSSSTTKKLRVLCAGVWCNVVFSIVCFFGVCLLSFFMIGLSSLGTTNWHTNERSGWRLERNGVTVTNVSMDSAHYNHLVPGDRITAVNGCKVRSVDDLRRCLAVEPFGYCLRDDEFRQIKVKTSASHLKALAGATSDHHAHHNCCGNSPAALAAGICFSRAEVFNQSFNEVQCVNIRRLLQFRLDHAMCYNSSDECNGPAISVAAAGSAVVSSSKFCYMPVLDPSERLFIVDKYSATIANDTSPADDLLSDLDDDDTPEKIVIIGSLRDVLSSEYMQSFRKTPNYRASSRPVLMLPTAAVLVEWLYSACANAQTFLNMCAGVSIAIGLLNLIPCMHLDGDKLVRVICLENLHGHRCQRFVSFLTHALIYGGTALVMATVAIAFSSALLDAW